MPTSFFTHPACLLHENAPGHPESPERLKAILVELEKPDYDMLRRREAPQATMEQIARVHDRAYAEDILSRVPPQGYVPLGPDTALSPYSGEAALRAAGALCAAVDEVMTGRVTNAFCAVRPPGHHAEHATAMGFCFFNNIAIGAAHVMVAHGVKRIALVDFDVHHGNGTQEWAEGQDGVFFCSSHEFPQYPGTGHPQEKGPKGNILNIALPHGTDGAGFRRVMQDAALPAITGFQPELIMISAGFDAHAADPLAGLRLTEEDYGWITTELCVLAKKFCNGRVVSALEGGYDVAALARSVGAHVRVLMEA